MESLNGGPRDALEQIEWGVAASPRPGQAAMGDRHVVQSFDLGVLIGAVDGLGHGTEAAEAARIATTTLENFAGEPVTEVMKRCHDRLTGTRGVVMGLASLRLSDQTMTWLGVGNVEAMLAHAPTAERGAQADIMISGAGVVGYQLPPLRPVSLALQPGDVAIFATDGVRSDFTDEFRPIGSAQRMADRILAQFGKETDDALVLVVRYLGEHA